jgi:hypothetical protein
LHKIILEGPDSLQPPDDGCCDGDNWFEVFDISVEAGGDAPPAFDVAKQAFISSRSRPKHFVGINV